MIRAHVFREGQELTAVAPGDLAEARAEPHTLIWVDLVSPSAEELQEVGEEFGIHPLALEDCRDRHQRPKVDEYHDHIFLVAYGAEPSGETTRSALHEVDIVTAKQFVLTVHNGTPLHTETIARRVRAHPELAPSGAGFLLYVVLDELVDSFFPTLDAIGDRVEDLEEAIFDGQPRPIQTAIYELRRDLIAIRRVTGPMRDAMVVLLRRDLGLFTPEAQRYLQDIYDHLIRVVEQVEDYQDLTSGALEVNLSVASNRVNEVAKTLTAWAAIFAEITLITGIYGMNFRRMPELGWRFGYAWALGVMATAAAGLWLYFRRKQWL
ncbi:MAG TPA: magnesium/cobalt transporter CorA [Actinomycetes bacterium]|jgi:magnesium transporter|nr:magnesium/cobalt transporter CorA [Actinomycetes bacterium]